MKQTYTWVIGAVIVIILVVVLVFVQHGGSSGTATSTAATSSAQTGATSGGAPVTAADLPDAPGTYITHINQSATRDGVTVTPTAIVEDSRCPVDVQCIQAGTVKVAVKFSYGIFSTTRTLTLGQMISGDGFTGGLVAVSPDKHEGQELAPGDYILTFTIAKQ